MMTFVIVQSVFVGPMAKLADSYGRRPVLVTAVIARGIIGTAIALSPDFTSFVFFGCLFEIAQAVGIHLILSYCKYLKAKVLEIIRMTDLKITWLIYTHSMFKDMGLV